MLSTCLECNDRHELSTGWAEAMTIEECFDEFIDETNQTVTIMGIDFDPSRILKELDPTAYRCGLAGFEDSEESERQEEAREDSNL